MKYLRYPLKIRTKKHVTVEFSKPVKLLIFSDREFRRYKDGMSCHYYGGEQKESPYEITLPPGYYQVVFETGGRPKEEVKPIVKAEDVLAAPPDPVIAELEEVLESDSDEEQEGPHSGPGS